MGCNTSAITRSVALDKPALGVLRLDYSYPPNDGDIDSATSFGYDVQYKTCKGLTFEMCKGGIAALTKEVQSNFEAIIQEFTKNPMMMGVTGDCGFMMAYQEIATAAAGQDVPVFMSSVMQCPLLAYTMEPGKKIAVLTADGESFVGIQESMLGNFRHSSLTMDRFKIVGCENVPHFKENIDVGNRLPYDIIAPGIVELCVKTCEEDKDVRAILLECTELPPFADDIRAKIKMPVLDAITCCDFFISAVGGKKGRMGTQGWGTLKYLNKESGEHLLHITRAALRKMPPAEVDKMEDAPKLGVISPEDSHIAGMAEKATFGYSIVHDVVKGLTVDMVRNMAAKNNCSTLTDAVKEELKAKVRCLAEDHSCIGIAGSHGFMVVLQEVMLESAIKHKIPVFMSPLIQLPSILRVMMSGSKVLIVNADCSHFFPSLVTSYGFNIPPETYVAKGCDLIPGFKEALDKTTEPIPDEFGPKIVELVKEAMAEDKQIHSVVLDSVSLIRFAERIRAETKMHVYDASTLGLFFHAGFADNPRFGKMGWQKEH